MIIIFYFFYSGFGLFLVKQEMVETMLPDGLETSGQREYR